MDRLTEMMKTAQPFHAGFSYPGLNEVSSQFLHMREDNRLFCVRNIRQRGIFNMRKRSLETSLQVRRQSSERGTPLAPLGSFLILFAVIYSRASRYCFHSTSRDHM